jgi:hypothetical protein
VIIVGNVLPPFDLPSGQVSISIRCSVAMHATTEKRTLAGTQQF